jgi:hypothetical protein
MFYYIREQPEYSPDGKTIWDKLELEKLCIATTNKCFEDNAVIKGKGEINYT